MLTLAAILWVTRYRIATGTDMVHHFGDVDESLRLALRDEPLPEANDTKKDSDHQPPG